MYLPDGTAVGYSLLSSEDTVGSKRSQKGRRRAKEPADGWLQPAVRLTKPALTEDDEEQLAQALRAGRSRRRRFLHDSMLRDLAGIVPLLARTRLPCGPIAERNWLLQDL